MFVTAVSTPAKPRWRWRITSHAGSVVDESRDEFATITAALQAGRTRAAQIDESDEAEKRGSWRRWQFARRVSLLVAGLSLVAGIAQAGVPTPKDFAERNHEARQHERAGAGPVADSEDAQLSGMDRAGAKDPVYRTVYRICLRKRGFRSAGVGR